MRTCGVERPTVRSTELDRLNHGHRRYVRWFLRVVAVAAVASGTATTPLIATLHIEAKPHHTEWLLTPNINPRRRSLMSCKSSRSCLPAGMFVRALANRVPTPTTMPRTPTTTPSVISTTTVASKPTAASPQLESLPPQPTATLPNNVPARGEATQWGCEAALAYLAKYADPNFETYCPGPRIDTLATTCMGGTSGIGPCAPGQDMIDIAVPCPTVYENEASNSWVLSGSSAAPIDPFGSSC